jgi:hypothetical protein
MAFCFLCLSSKLDRFTLELALSEQKKYPFDVLPGIQAECGKTRIRINHLIKAADHGWWNLNLSHIPDLGKILRTNHPEELAKAEDRIPALVADAIQQLAKVLSDFLDRNPKNIS